MIIQITQLHELQNLKENLQDMTIHFFTPKIYHFHQNTGLTGLLRQLEEKKEVIIIKNWKNKKSIREVVPKYLNPNGFRYFFV
jgi:hypothetical protein